MPYIYIFHLDLQNVTKIVVKGQICGNLAQTKVLNNFKQSGDRTQYADDSCRDPTRQK